MSDPIEPVLLLGDCVETMRGMEPNSVDAVVCDPPYGLEFMGREWDKLSAPTGGANFTRDGMGKGFAALPSFRGSPNPSCLNCGGSQRGQDRVGFTRCRCEAPEFPETRANQARAMQEWHEVWAREALRVLKPGGHLLAFGGTRTFHRLACAVEDAGFEIRDSISWLYGCLDSETEIMVDGRWELYHTIKEGRLALCYDPEHDEYSWSPIQRVVSFQHSDTAYRVVGDSTDQLLTREHRCLVEREGAFVFVPAEEIARQREARVPILEDVQDLLSALPLPNQGAGHPQQDLLQGLFQRSGQSRELRETRHQPQPVAEVSDLREKVSSFANQTAGESPTSLFASVSGDTRRGFVEGDCIKREGWLDGRIAGVIPNQNGWGQKPGLEGWSDLLPQEGELPQEADQVRAVPAQFHRDGSEGRLCDGAPSVGGSCLGPSVVASRGSASRGSRPREQRIGELATVRDEQGSQAVRGSRFTTTDLVRVEPCQYDGIMWCITVATGAFVARRRGKVFVTGNSGFPKSLDVSKAIDKAAGAEREVVGKSSTKSGIADGNAGLQRREIDHAWAQGKAVAAHYDITAPATPEAQKWQGWGTALKPAHEPIVVARKPLVKTVASNVLTYGTGALNIDGCRVSTADSLGGGAETITRVDQKGNEGWTRPWMEDAEAQEDHAERVRANVAKAEQLGRWPSNVVLSHSPECEMIGTGYGDADGKETVEEWRCVEGCPVAELDAQSGVLASGTGAVKRRSASEQEGNTGAAFGAESRPVGTPMIAHGDEGGASRFFKTFPAGREGEESADRTYTDEGGTSFSMKPGGRRNDEGGASRFFPTFRYQAKPSRAERNAGCDAFEEKPLLWSSGEQNPGSFQAEGTHRAARNNHPCLLPEEMVLTEEGYRPISKVSLGDRVYAHNGHFGNVVDVFSSPCEDEVITIKVAGMSERTQATANHPFLVARPTKKRNAIIGLKPAWVKAGDLRVGDYAMTPRASCPKEGGPSSEWAWAAGLWVAEGSVLSGNRANVGDGRVHRYPAFSLSDTETAYVDRLRRAFPESKVSVYPKPDCHGVLVVVLKANLLDEWVAMFGKGARAKRIGPEVWEWGDKARLSLLEGYLAGDGWRRRVEVRAKTSSDDLMATLTVLAESVGWNVSVQWHCADPPKPFGDRVIEGGPYWQIEFRPPGGILRRPREVEWEGRRYVLRRVAEVSRRYYEGPVWNLTVEGAHTFQTNVGMSHNTVKSTALMSWLVRLVTPPGGTVLDPFMGSGSTGIACVKEGFAFIGIEREADYLEIAKARIAYAIKEKLAEPIPLDLDWGPAPEPKRRSPSLPPVSLFD